MGIGVQGYETVNTELRGRQNSGVWVNAQRSPLMGFIFSSFKFNFRENYLLVISSFKIICLKRKITINLKLHPHTGTL